MKQLLGILAILCLISFSALAHDELYNFNLNSWDMQIADHDDSDPWKGWATITVTNIMDEDWGDFHFSLSDMSNTVIFGNGLMLDSLSQPYAGYTATISPNQREIDFVFYGNPVNPSETVTFQVYTDNTANTNAWFGICLYPTPVPEPATMAFLGLGALAILRKK